MASREERSDQNQRKWRSRLERGRQDLSASVEAALVDNGTLGQQDEDDEQEPSSSTTGKALVPPRLSLQSRVLPALLPADANTAINSYPAAPSNSTEEPAPQNTGMLARLAQRFTAPFAAIGSSTKSHPIQDETVSPQNTDSHLAPVSYMESARAIEQDGTPLVRVLDTLSPTNSAAATTSQEKRRSLKRNAKVRLQTTEMYALPKMPAPPKIEERDTGEAQVSEGRSALDGQQLPPPAAGRQEEAQDVAAASELKTVPSQPDTAVRSSLFGFGAFECDEADVMITNTRITSLSVVLVTLTTNPGPVVVQYVSLQPQVGFTVHLTAPVTAYTTFNYVVLPGF